MSGITTGVGIFSGIDSASIIDQLLAVSGRPKTLAQQRVVQLQSQQTAFLDLNTRLNALKTAATRFGTARLFDTSKAASSSDTVLTATASSGAAAGSFAFTVDRLVSTQQNLSRGFADSTVSALGAAQFTFESAKARLDTQTRLSTLNGGSGITRGKINIRDSSGGTSLIDLSRVETVSEVLTAINTGSSGRVNARVDGDRLVIEDRGGGTTVALQVTDASGTTGTVASLGLDVAATGAGNGGLVNGRQINRVGSTTALALLNDGLGVTLNTGSSTQSADFQIKSRDGRTFDIDIGDIYQEVPIPGGSGTVLTKTSAAVSDLTGVINRINAQTSGAITAAVNSAGTGLTLTDTTTGATTFQVLDIAGSGRTTAAELGIAGSATGGGNSIAGTRLLAGINSTLTRNLLGGIGVTDSQVEATARDGSTFSFTYDASGSITDAISSFNAATGGKIVLELGSDATSFVVRDTTNGGGAFTVSGNGAASLGLDVDGLFTSSATGVRTQRKYVGQSTLVSTLNGGRGIGAGAFTIVDSYGQSKTVTIDQNVRTVDDVLNRINGSGGTTGDTTISIRARINNNGDGILIEEVPRSTGAGARAITITDTTGGVARSLRIAGTATGTGAANTLDGSFEKRVTFSINDTLQQVADKINSAGVDATATVVNDGAPGTPFRLNLSARNSGEAGRFLLDTGGLDLGLTTLAEGTNARVFFGASDPARAVLVSSSSNTINAVAPGLSIALKSESATPVNVTVTADEEAVEKGLEDFVKAFNDVVTRISLLTKFDEATKRKGALLGDGLTQDLQSNLNTTINAPPTGVSGRYQFFSQIGITFGRDGTLELDKDELREALTTDRQAVKDLISAKTAGTSTASQPVPGVPGATVAITTTGGFSALGLAEKLAQTIEKYTRSVDGILTRRGKTIDEQIKSQNDRIKSIDSRLESQRTRFQRQFLAAESAIGRLKNQQGALSSIQRIA
ncbi:MAG: flagellar filament capping protein FliD [Phycisphaerales bacterium]